MNPIFKPFVRFAKCHTLKIFTKLVDKLLAFWLVRLSSIADASGRPTEHGRSPRVVPRNVDTQHRGDEIMVLASNLTSEGHVAVLLASKIR